MISPVFEKRYPPKERILDTDRVIKSGFHNDAQVIIYFLNIGGTEGTIEDVRKL